MARRTISRKRHAKMHGKGRRKHRRINDPQTIMRGGFRL